MPRSRARPSTWTNWRNEIAGQMVAILESDAFDGQEVDEGTAGRFVSEANESCSQLGHLNEAREARWKRCALPLQAGGITQSQRDVEPPAVQPLPRRALSDAIIVPAARSTPA